DGVGVAGDAPARHPVDLQPRLPGRAVRRLHLGRALRRHQLRRRHALWRPRSPHPRPLTWSSRRRWRGRASASAPRGSRPVAGCSSSCWLWWRWRRRGWRRRTPSARRCVCGSSRRPWRPPTAGRTPSAPITSVLGPSFPALILVIGLSGWVSYARVLRAQVLGLRTREFVDAVQALGGSAMRVVLRHIVPNVLSSLIVIATLELARAIVLEA